MIIIPKEGLHLLNYRLKILLLTVFIVRNTQCVDCQMTETISFSECRTICKLKYGED